MGIRDAQPKLPQYDKLRAQTQQRFSAEGQKQGDALQRKFAALGNLQSGAAIKQQQNLNSDVMQQQEQAMGGIDAQEAQEVQRQKEVQDARDFAANESRVGREFAGAEADKGRTFQAGESALSRRAQGDQFDRSFGEQVKQNSFTNDMATKEAALNEKMTHYNQALSLATSGKQNGVLDAWNQLFPGEAPQQLVDKGNASASNINEAIAKTYGHKKSFLRRLAGG